MLLLLPVLFVAFAANSFSQSFALQTAEAKLNHSALDTTLRAGGVAAFDYNNDGLVDIFLTGGSRSCKLYKNLGNNEFQDVTLEANLSFTKDIYTRGVAVGDIDNDGFRDLIITTGSGKNDILLQNTGASSFLDITVIAGITTKIPSSSASFADVNKDGYLDIYIGTDTLTKFGVFYINNKNKTFTEKSGIFKIGDPGQNQAATFSDFDNDGDLDLFVANKYNSTITSSLYRNDSPVDAFTNLSAASLFNFKTQASGLAVGDYDNDQDLDYYISNLDTNFLKENQGNGIFSEVSAARNARLPQVTFPENPNGATVAQNSWGAAFADYNNDGLLDLFVANGSLNKTIVSNPNVLLQQNAQHNFTDVSAAENFNSKVRSRGLAYADFDNDGDLDVIVATVTEDAVSSTNVLYYVNKTSNTNRWLSVKIEGSDANRDAVGAKVRAYFKNRVFTREIDGGGSSYQSQNTNIAHFGLDTIKVLDSVVVTFPVGAKSVLYNVNTNQKLNVLQRYVRNTNLTLCEGYVFKGLLVSKDTVLSTTQKAFNGADSVLTVTITMTPKKYATVNRTLCAAHPFEIDGKIYNKDTNVVKVYQSASLCDSVVTYKIKVLANTTANKTVNICKGAFYNGKTYDTTVTIKEQLINKAGCDSIVTTKINVYVDPNKTKDTTICWGAKFDDDSYFVTTKTVKVFTSFTGCDSTITYNINVLPRVMGTTTVTVKYGDTLFGKKWYENGQYESTITRANKCDSTHITKISVDLSSIDNELIYTDFALNSVPNPAQNDAEITFAMEKESNVELRIFDISGNSVATIFNGKLAAGTQSFTWNLTNSNGNKLAAGTYICRIVANGKYQDRKIVISK